jgi:nucleoside-diphosphate-sugar epimerase
MTDDKNFKRLVRARMTETGESYTQAHAALVATRPSAGAEAATSPLPRDARIFVTGHRGLVGSAIVRLLQSQGYSRILTATREQLDLRDQAAVSYWFRASRPDYVFLVAGTVGGILANSARPAEFLYDNMLIHGTVVHSSHEYNIGTGTDETVRTIAETVRDIVHPDAEVRFDPSKPDGMPRKMLDVSRIHALGWRATITLRDGLRATYDWYRSTDRVRGPNRVTTAA